MKASPFSWASCAKVRRQLLTHLLELDRGDFHAHCSGLDLGHVEDVADERQQVRAGAVDGLGVLDLLRGQVLVAVVAEHLAQDEQAVERRPQLVRHIGQELGLVLRRQRQLLGPLLQGLAGQLDLVVLLLDLGLLAGEQPGLLLQLLVALLELILLLREEDLGLAEGGRLLLQPRVLLLELLLLTSAARRPATAIA